MRRNIRAAVLFAAISGLCVVPSFGQIAPVRPATRPSRDAQQVPVKAVVLFTSGVGYFEHFGEVQGNATAELSFKTPQINDILKSLLIEDLDGGKVSVVTYASQEPLERTLKSFEVDLNDNPPLAQILTQLRGSSVTATLPGGAPVTGLVLGVESKVTQVGAATDGKTVIEWMLDLLLPGGTIRPIPLDHILELKIDDPKLQRELVKALGAVAASRDQDKKPVSLRFNGEGPRRVRVGYVVEAPVWKASYRLVLSPDAKNEQASDRKPADTQSAEEAGAAKDAKSDEPKPADGGKLLGWAIVENQTDNDWEGIQLSLMSGRPISFIEDLYQPLYVPRQVMEPHLYASLRPQTYDSGIDLADVQNQGQGGAMGGAPGNMRGAKAQESSQGLFGSNGSQAGGGGGNARPRAPMMMQMAQQQPSNRLDPTASVSPAASGAQIGELFQYTVPDVTLSRQKSAMIPILSDGIKVRRVSIYNESVLATNPLLGARLTNTTGKLLPQGPLTVLDAGGYAGDAEIDDLPTGQDRLLSYGIDQQIIVHAKDRDHQSGIVTGKIVKGVLEITSKNQEKETYVAQNKGKSDRALLIEHPKSPGWKLVEPRNAVEVTDAVFRFEQPLAAGKTESLTVTVEEVSKQTFAILPMETATIEAYVKMGPIPQKVKDALAKAAQLRYALVDTQRDTALHQQQLGEFNGDQTRIRENMKTVAQNSDYYQKLLKKLDEQETAIEKLQADIKALQQKQQQQLKELEEYLLNLDVA